MRVNQIFCQTPLFPLAFLALMVSADLFAQDPNCNFLALPDTLEVGCDGGCTTISPDFERAPETDTYGLDSIGFSLPMATGVGTLIGNNLQGYTDAIGIGFPFSFYGNDYFTLKAHRKGYVVFDTGYNENPNYPNQDAGSSNLPMPGIWAPFGYVGGSGGEIRYAILGEAPCRKFILSFEAMPLTACSPGVLTSQVILYETTNIVEIHIDQFSGCIPAIVGIQGSSNNGMAPAGFDMGEFDIAELAWRFSPNGASQTEVTYMIDGVVVGMGDSLEVCPTETTEYVVGINFPEIEPGTQICVGDPASVCDTTLLFIETLNANEVEATSFNFAGLVTGFSVTVNWPGGFGASWPGDLSLTLCDPSGQCAMVTGYNVDLPGIEIGDWPTNWNTTSIGTYNASFAIDDFCLGGEGLWELNIMNGWSSSFPNILFQGSITLNAMCIPDPEEPDTSEFAFTDTVLVMYAAESSSAIFEAPVTLCTGEGLTPMNPEMTGGVWTVDCPGCIDNNGVLDPSELAPGGLDVTYTLAGDCGDVTETETIQIGFTPQVNTGLVGDLCPFGDPVELTASPFGGSWSSDCGDCLTDAGLFDPSVGTGSYEVMYAVGSLCVGSDTVNIEVSSPVVANLGEPLTVCEDDGLVQMESDLPGLWSADCGTCIDESTGLLTLNDWGTFDVTFSPENQCSVTSTTTVVVDAGISINSSNIPNEICQVPGDLLFLTDVLGGSWSSSVPGLNDSLFNPMAAPAGEATFTYAVVNGMCTASTSFESVLLPELSVDLTAIEPLCVNEGTVQLVYQVDGVAENGWENVPSLYWDSDCGNCILSTGVFNPANAGPGTYDISLQYNHVCSVSDEITVSVFSAVDASIVMPEELCESGAEVGLNSLEPGGVWSADCGNCISTGGDFDPGNSGPGSFEVTYFLDGVCSDMASVDVLVLEQRDAVITMPDALCLGANFWQPGVLWPNGYWWTDCDAGTACIDSVTGRVNLNSAGVGTLTIHHDLLGLCGDSDTHTVEIQPCLVELVNIFTPNNDGFNDLLVFTNIELYPGNVLSIFDRWGKVVYEMDNYQNNWRGDGVAEGTLYFVLQLPDGIEHSGYLMLKR